jgi:Tfp pilus assembly protein FimV
MHQAKLKAFALLLAYSGCACAMQIGEMEVESHLGEPFRAMVAITPSNGESIDASCITLDPSPSNDGLFQLKTANLKVLGETGPRIVKISTVQKINEPIISLKLELQCGNVTVEKAFTAFLDPVSAPVEPVASNPIRRIETQPSAKIVQPRKFEGTVLTVRPNDTLSGIAHDFYPYSTMAQRRFVASVLRENPNLSPNHLEAGSKLRIPYIGPKPKLPEAKAAARSTTHPKAPEVKPKVAEVKPKVAEVKPKAPEVRPNAEKPAFRLAIVSDAPKQEAVPGPKAAANTNRTEEQLVAKADSQTVQLIQLQSQIKMLEANLSDLRRKVAIADRMLANSQAEKPSSSLPWIWLAAAIILLGTGFGAFWNFRNKKKDVPLERQLDHDSSKLSLAEHLDFFDTDSKEDW